MTKLGFLLLTISAVLSADTLPVDLEIADLVARARYLEDLKEVLSENKCRVQIDGNTVALSPGAIRSLNLIIAIGTGMPGNYVSFHKAPKPQLLRGVVEFTIKKPAGKIHMVKAELLYQGNVPSALTVSVGTPGLISGTGLKHPGSYNPFSQAFWAPVFDKGEPPMWDHFMIPVTFNIPQNGDAVVETASTNTGVPFRVLCN